PPLASKRATGPRSPPPGSGIESFREMKPGVPARGPRGLTDPGKTSASSDRSRIARMTRLAAAVLTVAACAMVTASTARAAPAFMSCGFNDAHGPLTYKQRPARCHYSSDGSTANLINLVGIRWTNWGQLRATGAAWRVDNHDQDWNGFQRHPVKVVV